MYLSKLVFIVTYLLFIGCGSDDNRRDTPEIQEAKSIDEAQNNLKSLSALSTIEGSFSSISSSANKMQKQGKTESYPCSKGGTVSSAFSEDAMVTTMNFHQCKEGERYIDGEMVLTYDDSRAYSKMLMKNMTLKDSDSTFSTKSFIVEDNEIEYWSIMNGDLAITSKCFTGNFNIKTLEKMYLLESSDYVETGKILLNGATYTFESPNVTIELGSKSRTLSQDELEKEFNDSSKCSE